MPTVEVIARGRRDQLGEGPLWSSRDQSLYWVDILDPHLNQLDLMTGAVTATPLAEPTGWVIERQAGGFIAGSRSGFHDLVLSPFRMTPIGDPERDIPTNRMNDAKADASGCIWAGTMGDGVSPSGSLYRLDRGRNWEKVDTGYSVTNGPAISADGRSLFHTDSYQGVVYRFDLSDEGELSNKRLFVRFEQEWGSPDGMTFDAEGGLWIAHWGGSCISRFSMTGVREDIIDLPTPQITSLTFAGQTLDRMFVTSAAVGHGDSALAGALFEILAPGVCGIAPCRYAG